MTNSQSKIRASASRYRIGIVLAAIFTLVAFGSVRFALGSPLVQVAVIAIAAILQIIVHLTYFLHLDFRRESRERLIAFAFVTILIFIVSAGTIWIMFNLNSRMTAPY